MQTPAHALHYCSRCGIRRARSGSCDRDGTQLTQILDSSLLGAEVGNYVVVQRLGEGGMGAVYRAIQPSIGAEVAIKVLHATAESQSDAVQRFLLEAQAVNRVRHGNLLRIIDTGYLPDRRPYLVMELLDGITLAEAVGKLPYALACHVAAEALDALDAVHDEGIVHRDLKPANIFLARDGRVVVLDFGIAKLVTPDGSGPATKSGIIGTPEYMAPEQIRSWPIDRRTDVYAMGILLYETVTGRRPFAAAATFDMLVQHLERPPTSPRDWIPSLPDRVTEIILTALEKAPARRFQSGRAMAAALRATTTASRGELATFVVERAAAPAPVPIQTPPTPDPGQSASGPTQPDVVRSGGAPTTPQRSGRDMGVPTTPGKGRSDRIRETPTETVRPPTPRRDSARDVGGESARDDDDDASATIAARPSSADRADRTDLVRRRSPVLAILVAVGLAATAIVIALLVTRRSGPDTPAPVDPSVVAPVAVPPVTPVTPADATVIASPTDAPAEEKTSGLLRIDSQPTGAAVFVDGVAFGPAPVTATLPIGEHDVRLKLAGHLDARSRAQVIGNVRSQLMIPLVKVKQPGKQIERPVGTMPGPSGNLPPPKDTGSAKPEDDPVRAGSGLGSGTTGRKPNPFDGR